MDKWMKIYRKNKMVQNLRASTLFIILTLSLLGVALEKTPLVKAVMIFTDGFESGDFSAWTGTVGQLQIITSTTHHGSYACYNSQYGFTGYAYKNFESRSIVFARAYILLDALPTSNLGIRFLNLRNAESGWGASAVVRKIGTQVIFSLFNSYWGVYTDTNIQVTANTWYCVEVEAHQGLYDGCKLYINGNLAASFTYGTIVALNQIRTKEVSYESHIGLTIDCVVVADTYIGLEVPQYQVSLSSEQDDGRTTNKGKIKVGTTQYILPNTITLGEGRYSIQYMLELGYEFKQWITTGSVSVANFAANPTTLTVSGTGTLKAVYQIATPKLYRITIDSQQHEDYGLGYPVTYVFQIPSGSSNLKAYHRHTPEQIWSQLTEKTSDEFFNGIECVRFDYTNGKAYVSVSFDENYDDIYIKITDANDNPILFQFIGIAEYYDNRKAVVTATADDWGGYIDSDPYWIAACNIFRSYNVWLTVGVITQGAAGGKPDWKLIQEQVDSGYIEIASHSATHPIIPYDDYDQEIGGSKQDIINNLNLPAPYKKGNKEYVWAWLEPFDGWDNTVRQKLGQYKYLVDRTSQRADGYDEYATWDVVNSVFNRIGVVGYADTFTLQELNEAFDDCYNRAKIYHLFFHAPAHDWSLDGKVSQHLNYISGKRDVWYVGFGALYAYRYVSKVAAIDVEEYKLDTYTLTVNIVGTGYVSKNPDKTYYYYGESVTLTALPEIGWSFSHWSGDLIGSINPQSITIDGNKVVTATFTQNQYSLNINIVGSGSVTKNPDQETYTYGTSVTLTANPSSGWSFVGWSGDATGSANPIIIMMDGSKNVTATFDQNVYTLSIIVEGNGTVIKNPDQAVYTYGAQVELIAVPNIGWSFEYWNGDLTGSANPASILIDANKTIIATFTRNAYNLNISIVGSGSVFKVPNKTSYHYGEVVNLTATPVTGWRFTGWSGNLTGNTNPAIITITGDTFITAAFAQEYYTLNINIAGNGQIIRSPDQATYTYGTPVELTAVPALGWFFAGWSGDLSGSTNPATVVMTCNKTITAKFTTDQYTLTINIVGSGSVSKLPDQNTYAYGSLVQLTASPEAGWVFNHWDGDLSGSENPVIINVTSNMAITALFSQEQYTLTISVMGSGSVKKSPDQATYAHGSTVKLTAEPDAGWSFIGWSGDATGIDNPITITIDGNKTITATFAQNTYALAISIVGSGSVDINNTGPYHYGDIVKLTAIPSVGWDFDRWGGDLDSFDNPTTLLIDSNKIVTATFIQNTYALTVTVMGGGSVNMNNTGPYYYGDVVELIAIPFAGWSFSGWGGDVSSIYNPLFLTITGNFSVTATFTQNQYALIVNVVGAGCVFRNPDKSAYTYGEIVKLTAEAEPGWNFSGWGGDISGTVNPITIVIDRNKTVTAIFAQNTYTIVAYVEGAGGVIIPSGNVLVNGGEDITFTIIPDAGYRILNVRVDGTYMGPQSSFTFYCVDNNHTIIALFAKENYTLTIIIVGAGKVLVEPNKISYSYGETVQLLAIPNNKNYVFYGWGGDLTGNANPATLIMDGNKTVIATFVRKNTKSSIFYI